jgi:hypothetical protein
VRYDPPRQRNHRCIQAQRSTTAAMGASIAHSGRTAQARALRRRVEDPQDPQAGADTADTIPAHRYDMATVPADAGLDHAGRGPLPRRLRRNPETDLRLPRPEAGSQYEHILGRPAIRPERGPPQQARNLLTDLHDRTTAFRFLVRARAGQFTTSFDAVLTGAGIDTVSGP